MCTRDSHAIRSHAQKHFIKLYRDDLPLPDKVIESGAGYTLSGKELDPDSAAARPYLKGKRKSLVIQQPLGKENVDMAVDDKGITKTASSNTDSIKKL